jgi:predicted ATP-grasp superfamily ATP-dependent carboligase
VLQEHGLLFPEIRRTAGDLPRDGTWLEKSYQGASGSGVREVGSARVAGVDANERGDDGCYQRRVAGIPCAAVYVSGEQGAILLGVTRQIIGEPWLGAHGFQYAGSIGPWPIGDVTRSTLERLGNVMAEQFELLGLFGIDFMLNGEDVWTLEVNPRYTASVEVVERFTGFSAISLHAEACTGAPNQQRAGSSSTPSTGVPHGSVLPNPKLGGGDAPARAHGKAILFATGDLTISAKFAEFSFAETMREPWPTLADVSPAGTTVEQGRPILTIFAEGADVDEVETKLRDRSLEITALLDE